MFNLNSINDCIKIDLAVQKPLPQLELKQHSRANRYYHAQIVKKNMPVNISGYSVSVFYKKHNGKTILHPAEIINPKFGICQLLITEDLVNEYGIVEAEIYLKKGETTIVSPIFTIKIIKSVYQSDDTPSLDMQITQQEINKVRKDIGTLTELETEDKTSIVGAINRIEQKILEVSENTLEAKNSLDKKDIDRILSIFNI